MDCQAYGVRSARVGAGKETVKTTPKEHKLPLPVKSDLSLKHTNKQGMEFVLVPKGKSWLGGGGGKPGDKEVEIPYDFYLGKYEVTQEEWEKLIGRHNPNGFKATGLTKADQKRFPVENITWEDTQRFLGLLNDEEKEAGWTYRLPKSVEWEYACRGGPLADRSQTRYDFYLDKPTNQITANQANIEDGKGLKRPCKVGELPTERAGIV